MEIKIKVDAAAAIKEVRGIRDDQLPFALARALTMSAQDGQGKMIQELPQHFTLRTKWYLPQTPFGFKAKAATKRNFISEVYTKAAWMVDQEEGGIQTPRGKMFAIPSTNVRLNKKDLIKKTAKPKYLLKHGAFFAQMKSGKFGIFMRTGVSRLPIWLFYSLYPRVTIPPRLVFQETIEKVVTQKFPDNFTKAFNDAVKTAK